MCNHVQPLCNRWQPVSNHVQPLTSGTLFGSRSQSKGTEKQEMLLTIKGFASQVRWKSNTALITARQQQHAYTLMVSVPTTTLEGFL